MNAFQRPPRQCHRRLLDELRDAQCAGVIAAAWHDISEFRISFLGRDAEEPEILRVVSESARRLTERASEHRFVANVVIRWQNDDACLRIALRDVQQWQQQPDRSSAVLRLHDHIAPRHEAQRGLPPPTMLLGNDRAYPLSGGDRLRAQNRFLQQRGTSDQRTELLRHGNTTMCRQCA